MMRIKVKVLEPEFFQIVSEHMYIYVYVLYSRADKSYIAWNGYFNINTIGPYDIK